MLATTTLDLPICSTCGTQFGPTQDPKTQPFGCRICADPRQFVLPSGTTYTTLTTLQSTHKNQIELVSPENENLYHIYTTPKFGIGQRCFFLKTPSGNIIFDLIAFLDAPTVDFINSHGGVKAIIISHPHYYTTHRAWSEVFNCPIYVAPEDKEWLSFDTEEQGASYSWLNQQHQEILPGVTAVKVGGHFPGSLCLHIAGSLAGENSEGRLLIADSLVTVPSARGPYEHPPKGVASYSFMWSIPNMIPMPVEDIRNIGRALEPYSFNWTHGAFPGLDVTGTDVKQRVRDSIEIAVGWMMKV
ncbi:beta-lactamase-like protein [Pyronema omphalodes]|nr:beta-lactamase-like protein [Pyronema omphalodes]